MLEVEIRELHTLKYLIRLIYHCMLAVMNRFIVLCYFIHICKMGKTMTNNNNNRKNNLAAFMLKTYKTGTVKTNSSVHMQIIFKYSSVLKDLNIFLKNQ